MKLKIARLCLANLKSMRKYELHKKEMKLHNPVHLWKE